MDIKGQANRGKKAAAKWDQRKTTGAFQGAPDLHVATVVEFRANDDVADLLTNPDRIHDFIQPGDNILMVVNRVFGMVVERQPGVFAPIASVAGLGGDGPVDFDFFAYDND